MNMTVMTFNLRYDTPDDGESAWPHRVNGAAQMIQDHNPLLVGTQEGFYPMLMELQEQIPEYAWVGHGRMGEHENEHCAVFYKASELEVQHQGQFWLSETPFEPASKSWDSHLPRICTWISFLHKTSQKQFVVYNTHLDHLGEQARKLGTALIWENISSHRIEFGLPVVLMGDMNSHPSDWPIRFLRGELEHMGKQTWLKDAYTALSGSIGLTAHSFQGGDEGEPIDYIFVSPEIEVLKTEVDRRKLRGVYPSDHYPIVSQLRLSDPVRVQGM
ncbi:Metal-dependent hydrolase, endonuclease/exonuclease/phosphatase family [Paenibacillus sp. 1_12]|uniref:endonuclease/exonuclease/phosphatase family protein n=1 Tax=Paenibacillus sp. 1_12 TaxID=1566278 RepID=UPI0008E19C15|nr:endonuclease/exonuclease/phosphatase family protein [Paenibacillus sp. 1_12]SFL08654.1 Metal-dependent hydrolase, endonuclease/exonuclease/phosphatase family [Paenibacillus sp. 1_12]